MTTDLGENKQLKIGEVYLVEFSGENSVQRGLRPAVIFQNNIGNNYSPNVVVLPLTTSMKRMNQPTHVFIPSHGTGLKRDSMVLCENPFCIPKSQLGNRIADVPSEYMEKIAIGSVLASSAISFLNPELLKGLWEQAKALNVS